MGAVRVPPVIVSPPLTGVGVTRMPPDWRVFVPESVSVRLPVLNRTELVVNALTAAEVVTSVLMPAA